LDFHFLGISYCSSPPIGSGPKVCREPSQTRPGTSFFIVRVYREPLYRSSPSTGSEFNTPGVKIFRHPGGGFHPSSGCKLPDNFNSDHVEPLGIKGLSRTSPANSSRLRCASLEE